MHQIIRKMWVNILIHRLFNTASVKKISAAVIMLLSLTTVYAQTIDKAKLDKFFDRLNEKNKAMGSLLITREGKTIYNRTIGYSVVNKTEHVPLKDDTRYRIGSVTKMFTAVIIFQLVEEKRLKLDDTLSRFFPQIPNAGKITIEQLLAHRSGIPEMLQNPEFRTLRFKASTHDEILALIAKSKPEFEPGTKYAYNNSGYFILAMVIEKLTGKPYAQVLKERITSRIGLKDTYPATGSIDISKNECYSYKFVTDWEQQPETHPDILFGSGFMVSTTKDMARFIEALFTGKLVSQQSLELMMQQESGIAKFTYNGKTAYGHTGGVDGFGAWLVYLPQEKLSLSYATNGKVYSVENIINGAFDIYYNKPFTVPDFESIAISAATLDKYAGIYGIGGAPVKFTVRRDNTTLLLQVNGRAAAPLEPTGDNKFKIESVGMEIVFDVEKKQMTIIRNGQERVFNKEN